MDIASVVEAQRAIADLKPILPPEAFRLVSEKVAAAFDEILEVKHAITEPIPRDADGAPKFPSLEVAVKRYVDERDALRLASAAFKKVEDQAKGNMQEISMWLRDRGDELGVDSFKTQYGTAYRSVKTSYRMGDWTSFLDWIKATDNFQCLEKRVAKLATKEIHDQTGVVPPGIEYFAEVEFDVRRPTKKASGSDE